MKKTTLIAGSILMGCAVLASCSSSEGNVPDPEQPRLNAIVLNSSDFKDKYGTEYVWLWSDGTITAMPGLDEVPSPIVNGMFYTNAEAPMDRAQFWKRSHKKPKSLYKTTPGGSFTLIADSLYDCGYFSCGLIPIKRTEDSPVEFLDENGKTKFYFNTSYVDPYFYKGFARYGARSEGNPGFGVIDNKGNIIVLEDYCNPDLAYQVTDSLLLVGNKVMDHDGNILIDNLREYGITANNRCHIINGCLGVPGFEEDRYQYPIHYKHYINYYSLIPEVKLVHTDSTGNGEFNLLKGAFFGREFFEEFNYVLTDEFAKYLEYVMNPERKKIYEYSSFIKFKDYRDIEFKPEIESKLPEYYKIKYFYQLPMFAAGSRDWRPSDPEAVEYKPTATAERVAREQRDARGF